MTTNNLTMAQLLAFLFKQYGPESLKQFLIEVNQLGRYGDVLTIERQEETLSELETMGLHAVVETVKDAIPHQWEVDCPLPAVAEPHLVLEWFDEMAAKRKAFEERNSPPAS